MDIRGDEFGEEDINRHTMGAGVIPVSTDDDGVVRVLLGRERFSPYWKGSCRWSGFEGSRYRCEDITTTALREFTEESLGVVLPREALRSVIASGDHEMRIVLRIMNDRVATRYHCTYIVHIPWDDEIPRRFERTRLRVQHIDRLMQEVQYWKPEWMDGQTSSDVMDISSKGIRGVLVDGVCHYNHKAEGVLRWTDAVKQLGRAMFDHECLRGQSDARGCLQSVRIEKDHLEKDQLRWWTLGDLDDVLRNNGHHKSERFRPYFLPVLQTLVRELISTELGAQIPVSAPRAPDPSPPAAPHAAPPPTAP